MNEAANKRKPWQFHLSSAVLFSLALGLLMYLNRPRHEYVLCYLENDNTLKQNLMYGFPCPIDWHQVTVLSPSDAEIGQIKRSHVLTLPDGMSVHVRETAWYTLDPGYTRYTNVISVLVDAAVAAAILACVAYLLRRREARKP
jgi:hypothetical protein